MTRKLSLSLRSAIFSAALIFLIDRAALAQDPASANPPPANPDATPSSEAPADASAAAPADASTPPADAAAAPADANAAPAEASAKAPEPVATIPVDTAKKEAPPKNATQLDTIEVTGSRLRRADYETAQPVVSISREDIEKTGLTDVSQILRHLSVAGNNSLTPQQGRFSLSFGEVNLDLRNLGSSHTLLLVNGRRWVTGLIADSLSSSDYNTIPTSVIERVEVLKDGASAIYGSDAIGGVVNIITRKDYEGVGLTYHVGQYYEQGDGTNQQASVSWGKVLPGTSLFVNLSYTTQDKAYAANRPLTATSTPGTGTTRWSKTTTKGRFAFIPDDNNRALYRCTGVTCDLTLNDGADGYNDTTGANDKTEYHKNTKTGSDVYNKFEGGSLQEPNERTALFAQYNQDLGHGFGFAFEGLYNVRTSTSVGQNLPLIGGQFANQSYLAYAPVDNPFNPFSQNIGDDCPGVTGDARNACGLGVGAGAWLIRLPGDRVNWLFHDKVQTLRLVGALNGNFDLFGLPLGWEGGYVYAQNRINDISPLNRFDKEAEALSANCTAPCVPLNIFHGQAGLTEAMLNYVFHDAYQRNTNRQDIAYLTANTELPEWSFLAGPVGVATGLEYRRNRFVSKVDPVVTQGLTILNMQHDAAGESKVSEAFVEFGIPLVKDLPLAQLVDLDIAGRYSRYPLFGDVTTGKVGLRWQPINDLLVRGTYSTGFRAPNIIELYGPTTQNFVPLADPCAGPAQSSTTQQNCAADGATGGGSSAGSSQGVSVIQPYQNQFGNPKLKPESSVNLTYGLVYSPHWVPDLNFNLDFYKIRVEDFIAVNSIGQYFLDTCYNTAQRAHCDAVSRQAGTLRYVNAPYQNYSAVETAGVDGGVDYVLPLPDSFGRVKVALDASYLTQYDRIQPHPGQGDDVIGLVGTDADLFDAYPRWKAGGSLAWKRDLWNVSWSTRMAYHMMEDCADIYGAADNTVAYSTLGLCSNPNVSDAYPAGTPRPIIDNVGATPVLSDKSKNKMATVFYHNVQIGRDFPSYNANVALGVNNVLDQNPPISYGMNGFYWYNYDPNHYETPGRQAYLRVGVKF